jgi:hypothetical protein
MTGRGIHNALSLSTNQDRMARSRRSKHVLALLKTKWLRYAALDHRPARWSLSDDGKTMKRDYPPFGTPKKSKRQEEAYKYRDIWWLRSTKGKGSAASTTVKEIVPIQTSKFFTLCTNLSVEVADNNNSGRQSI